MLTSAAAETCYKSLEWKSHMQAFKRNELQKSQVVLTYPKVTINREFVHKVAKKTKKQAWRVGIQIRARSWEEHSQLVTPTFKTEVHSAVIQVRYILCIWISVFTL